MSHDVKKVLLVDDEPDFLEAAAAMLSTFAGSGWQISIAQNVGSALSMIQSSDMDMVVLDVHMPVVDGLQFLSVLNRRHPDLVTAVLTANVTEEHRALCLSQGAELYLQKPQSREQWEALFTSLNELVRFKPKHGFRGVLRRVSIQDVLQMECLSRHSAVLEISTREACGHIYIYEGQIVHAEVGQRIGEDAFNYLMGLTGGEFTQRPLSTPPRKTISASWEFLLMEAARKRDESAPEGFTETPLSATKLGGPAITHTAFFTRTNRPAPEETTRPEVSEFLIFSSQGDLLYQWQCNDVAGRVGFLEFISQKARQLGEGLPLGHFEAFEIRGTKSRVITQIENDHAVFVRTKLLPI